MKNKITFMAKLTNRGTDSGLGVDFGSLEIADDERNDEFFKTETFTAKAFDGYEFEKKRTLPHSANIKLSNLPTEEKFIDSFVGKGIYRITIEKTDEEPKRYYEEEETHVCVDEAGKTHWHYGPKATCTTRGVQPKRNGSSSKDSSGNT